ncbi:hypothetical protein GPECTOR_41g648 [Gonium pectorale]|uniref:MYND-type domain-containing protein n=1 Tax=Gonium pectorale TaxID=33097 RepID=A0A150GA13_GONPE|nr:hypothetical protein GPECTOR_41g648 [Gonium pectorale]|eukprot:KXZ46684.1 hypothetical protein GPECTOR_41g648 [Gonium pectorale]
MRSVDSLVQLYDTDARLASNEALQARVDACNSASVALHKHFSHIQVRARAPYAAPGAQAAAALDWIQPCVDAGVVPWLSSTLKLIPSNVCRALDGAAPLAARRNATSSLTACGPSAFMLLGQLLDQLWNLQVYGDARQAARSQQLQALLLDRDDFAAPAAAAFRAWSRFTAALAQPRTQAALEGAGDYGEDDFDAGCCLVQATATHSNAALAACKHCWMACCLMANRLDADGDDFAAPAGGSGAPASSAAAATVPVTALVDALSSSGLVPAAAAMLLQPPAVGDSLLPRAPGLPYPEDRTAANVHGAAREMGQALCVLQCVYMRLLLAAGGSPSAPGVAELGRLLDDTEVAALRLAMLQRLAAHGGLQPPPPPPPPPQGEAAEAGALALRRGGGGGGGAGGGGGGGAEPLHEWWWLARVEARRGAVTGSSSSTGGAAGGTVGWLEDAHCHAICVSLGYWRRSELRCLRSLLPPRLHPSLAAPPPGAPPPLALARLAARTAEALCRLYRGQGLGGAYGPGPPEWMFVRNRALTDTLDFCDEASAGAVGEAEARACLPHWLEAAAWGLALCGEALAGAAEGRGGADAASLQRSTLAQESRLGNEAAGLARLLRALAALTTQPQRAGSSPLIAGVEARGDLSATLHRAGLGASLDRALRLAFTLFDRTAAAAPRAAEWERCAAEELRTAPILIALILRHRLVPMLQPYGAPTTKGARYGSGVVVTAAKRAGALARRLEEPVEGGGGGREGRRSSLMPSLAVLDVVASGAAAMREELRVRQQSSLAPGGGGATAPGGAAASAAAGAAGDARRAELLVLSVRSACHLAAQLVTAAARLAAAEQGGGTGGGSGGGDRDGTTMAALLEEAVATTALTLDQLTLSCPASCPECGDWGLAEAQLLACQPHRLLSAAASLVFAITTAAGGVGVPLLATALTRALVALASSPGLSARVRTWLEPPPLGTGLPRAGSAAAAAAAADLAELGCLERPLRAVLERSLVVYSPLMACHMFALLKTARGSDNGSGSGSDCSGGGDDMASQFRDTAMALSAALSRHGAGAGASGGLEVTMPDGTLASGALCQYLRERAGRESAEARAAAASAELPAPLTVAAAPLAARRLRMCANPRCTNFGRAAEADLGLKKCAGCRAVRYCGAGCQRAHWPEHRTACVELRAAAAVRTDS